jgi:hypothetical protein
VAGQARRATHTNQGGRRAEAVQVLECPIRSSVHRCRSAAAFGETDPLLQSATMAGQARGGPRSKCAPCCNYHEQATRNISRIQQQAIQELGTERARRKPTLLYTACGRSW